MLLTKVHENLRCIHIPMSVKQYCPRKYVGISQVYFMYGKMINMRSLNNSTYYGIYVSYVRLIRLLTKSIHHRGFALTRSPAVNYIMHG